MLQRLLKRLRGLLGTPLFGEDGAHVVVGQGVVWIYGEDLLEHLD